MRTRVYDITGGQRGSYVIDPGLSPIGCRGTYSHDMDDPAGRCWALLGSLSRSHSRVASIHPPSLCVANMANSTGSQDLSAAPPTSAASRGHASRDRCRLSTGRFHAAKEVVSFDESLSPSPPLAAVAGRSRGSFLGNVDSVDMARSIHNAG